MSSQSMSSQSLPQPGRTVSSNVVVTMICGVLALFMLCVAGICGALIRSDATMMALARPKICLNPTVKVVPAAQSVAKR